MAVKKRKKDLTFLEKIYIPEIAKGLLLTLKQMFRPRVTMQYPEEKFVPSAAYRGRPVLVAEKDGVESAWRADSVREFAPLWLLKLEPRKPISKRKDTPKNSKLICSVVSSAASAKRFAPKRQL